MLTTGATDAAIARRLGVSERTVQRDVRDLLGRLGARTRFQAGLVLGLRAALQPDVPRARA